MRKTNQLTSSFVLKKILSVRDYSDGGNLYLRVSSEKARSWVFRYRINGRERELGLGSAWDVPLADARKKADEYRRIKGSGVDPADNLQKKAKRSLETVFRTYVTEFYSPWSNEKTPAQWLKSIEYVAPLMAKPVDEITAVDVKEALLPLWHKIPDTARKIRGRLEMVLDYAKSHSYREGDNPARWKGNLAMMMPGVKLSEEHHKSLPYQEINEFMRQLKARPATSAKALEFVILTACRTSEAIEARWEEIDFQKKLWRIPARRMKARKDHVVPLSKAATELLERVAPKNEGYIFERKPDKPLSNNAMLTLLERMQYGEKATTHGFRSTFRDWAANNSHDHRLAEMCLAHNTLSKTEAAYLRDDMIEPRRKIMEAWSAFISGTDREGGNVVQFKGAAV